MLNEDLVLCCANAYQQKYYFNEKYNKIPQDIKDELQIMCVMFTEDIGGVIYLVFDEDGNLEIKVVCEEDDYLFDDIGCGLKIKQMQTEKRDLLEALEMFHKTFMIPGGIREDKVKRT